MLDLLLAEGSAIEASLGSLLPEGVAILSLEDKEEALLLRAISTAGQVIVGPQFGNGLTAGPRVLLDGLPDAGGIGLRGGGELVEGAELLGLAMEEVGLRLDVVLLAEGLADLLFVAGEDAAHGLTGNARYNNKIDRTKQLHHGATTFQINHPYNGNG